MKVFRLKLKTKPRVKFLSNKSKSVIILIDIPRFYKDKSQINHLVKKTPLIEGLIQVDLLHINWKIKNATKDKSLLQIRIPSCKPRPRHAKQLIFMKTQMAKSHRLINNFKDQILCNIVIYLISISLFNRIINVRFQMISIILKILALFQK